MKAEKERMEMGEVEFYLFVFASSVLIFDLRKKLEKFKIHSFIFKNYNLGEN